MLNPVIVIALAVGSAPPELKVTVPAAATKPTGWTLFLNAEMSNPLYTKPASATDPVGAIITGGGP